MLRLDVTALYVDPVLGPYPGVVDDWYDERRDATTYKGPRPVVSHPPCGAWGKLRSMYKGSDGHLGPIAVDQVRSFGGVLEHPAYSKLWSFCDLPLPVAKPDTTKPFTLLIYQSDFGLDAGKPTWIYVHGFDGSAIVMPPRRNPTRSVEQIRYGRRHVTPLDLAIWLTDLAGRCSAK